MIDKRAALPIGYEIKSDKFRNFKIDKEVGRGGNCLVYDAVFTDSIDAQHNVRVKELYPAYINIERNSQYELICDECPIQKYEEVKKLFIESYRKNVEFKNTAGLINSTINSSDIIEYNNTIYIIMTIDEGTDYGEYKDESLKEVFEHIKAVANVIRTYHNKGYLHLDIKPENIFVIPETTEHIYLFDFDSVCKITDISEGNIINISFSEGFSAPEQMQGRINKIGKHTDIYSIGAVLFYKLFRRRPEMKDCRITSDYSFEQMMYADKIYQPKLYKKLALFLRNTISTSPVSRWTDMDKVINELDELIKLADIEATYLIDTFTYNSACFVGREQEILDIHDALEDNQIVFLSGIGGIGKTELAKRYVYEYRDEYDTVAFAYYGESIEYTVCQEIKINNISMDEGESQSEYFGRILEVLKKTVTENDLIIIDNFDVEQDDRLEELLTCPCKFLITTRKDFRDYNYKQINVKCIEDREELNTLFSTYNDEIYSEDENRWIDELIEFVDRHTMTVELIAKYLRDSGCMPSELYERFMDKAGIINTEEYELKQRKDRRMNIGTVNNHLSILFDVFSFDDLSKEIISSLSVFAGMRIKKELFAKVCRVEGVCEKIESLIKNGWMEYDDATEKISLHQVIQDLIYTKLNPTTETCPHVAEGMLEYVEEAMLDERWNDIKIFDNFAERISGNDLLYFKICLAYEDIDKVNEAIEICLDNNQEPNDVLMKLYIAKGWQLLCRNLDLWRAFEENFLMSFTNEIIEILHLVIEYCNSQIMVSESLISIVELCEETHELLDEFCNVLSEFYDDIEEITKYGITDEIQKYGNIDEMLKYSEIKDVVQELLNFYTIEELLNGAYSDEMNKFYNIIEFNAIEGHLEMLYCHIKNFFYDVEDYMKSSLISMEERINIYIIIQRFYWSKENNKYINDKYKNMEKAYFCQNVLDYFSDRKNFNMTVYNEMQSRKKRTNKRIVRYRRWKEKISDIELSVPYSLYEHRNWKILWELDYKILEYRKYMNEIVIDKKATRFTHDITSKMIADLYMDEEEYDTAIFYYNRAYKEREEPYEKIAKCLIFVHYKNGDENKVKKYARELVKYEKRISYEKQDYYYILVAYYYMYLLENQEKRKLVLWKKCVEVFSKIELREFDEEMYSFIAEYFTKEPVDYKYFINMVVFYFDKGYRISDGKKTKLINKINELNKDEKSFIKCYVILVLKLVEIQAVNSDNYNIKMCYNVLTELEQILESNKIRCEYVSNELLVTKSKIMSNDSRYEDEQINAIKKQINYYCIAKHKCGYIDDKKSQAGIWREAAHDYMEIDDYSDAILCLEKVYEINLNNYVFFSEMLECYICLNRVDKAVKIIKEIIKENKKRIPEERSYYEIYGVRWKLRGKIKFNLYITALYIMTTPIYDDNILRKILNNDREIIDVCEIIIGNLINVNLVIKDELIEINNKLISLKNELSEKCEDEKVYKEYISKISNLISGLYQDVEI